MGLKLMQAVRLASSVITHTRHGKPSHFLSRSGFSVFIDLDKLMIANSQSSLFSVDKFNLISFHLVPFHVFHLFHLFSLFYLFHVIHLFIY